jgi:hypothetical protein
MRVRQRVGNRGAHADAASLRRSST